MGTGLPASLKPPQRPDRFAAFSMAEPNQEPLLEQRQVPCFPRKSPEAGVQLPTRDEAPKLLKNVLQEEPTI